MSAPGEEAVRRVLHTYALAVDTRDLDVLGSVFTADVVLHRVDGARTGRAAVLEFYRSVFDGDVAWTVHLVTNVLVDRADDGGLESRAAFHSAQLAGGAVVDIYGRYRHRFATEGERLCIAEKWIDVQQVFRRAAS
ncbi:nuclear transport factor 2 family protein [Pseudonocardia adelaidensis]|uniref:SnoaL-like domain-containing protein n=1 Tax=Pseudonocardia adelaidensis TaxID=648754 RepID=A0ABP9NX59_9PSEU